MHTLSSLTPKFDNFRHPFLSIRYFLFLLSAKEAAIPPLLLYRCQNFKFQMKALVNIKRGRISEKPNLSEGKPKTLFCVFFSHRQKESSREEENGGEAAIGEIRMPESAILQSNGGR